MDTELAALPDAADVPAEHAADLMVADHGDHDVGHPGEAGDAVWMPLLSLRFWTYGSCFFGLTGGVLTLLELVPAMTTLGLASGMGLACGYTASWTFQRLRRLQVSTSIGPQHYTGAVGEVLVPCGPGTPGKVRIRLRGQTIDLVAETEEEQLLPRGTRVVVVTYEDGSARVVHAGRLLAGLDDDDD